MEFKLNETKDVLFYGEDEQSADAYILFPKKSEGVHEITRVFVDEKYRGQGVAGKLMKGLVEYGQKENIKFIATCSYAENWFLKNSEFQTLLL